MYYKKKKKKFFFQNKKKFLKKKNLKFFFFFFFKINKIYTIMYIGGELFSEFIYTLYFEYYFLFSN